MYRSKERNCEAKASKRVSVLEKSPENIKFIYWIWRAFLRESGTINGFTCHVNIPNQTSHGLNFVATKLSASKPLAEFLSVIWQ